MYGRCLNVPKIGIRRAIRESPLREPSPVGEGGSRRLTDEVLVGLQLGKYNRYSLTTHPSRLTPYHLLSQEKAVNPVGKQEQIVGERLCALTKAGLQRAIRESPLQHRHKHFVGTGVLDCPLVHG